MKRLLAPGGVVLGLALVGYAVFGRETDEERIQARLDALEDAVRVDADSATNPLFRSAHLREKFRDIFVQDVAYRMAELGPPGRGREDLVGFGVRASSALTAFDVDFGSIDIRLEAGGTLADVTTVAKVRALRGAEQWENGERRVHFHFANDGGNWLVAAFEVSGQ